MILGYLWYYFDHLRGQHCRILSNFLFLGSDRNSLAGDNADLFGGLALSEEGGLRGMFVFLDVDDFERLAWCDWNSDLVDVIECVFGGDCVDGIQVALGWSDGSYLWGYTWSSDGLE